MRAKSWFVRLGAAALLFGLLLLPAEGAEAATKKSGVLKNGVLKSGTKTSCSIDMDGDDDKEKLELKTKTDSGMGFIQEGSLAVDGKELLSLKKTQALTITVDYVMLDGSTAYLRVLLTGANDFCESDYFYRYDSSKGKLIKAAELLDAGSGGSAVIKSAKNSEITVSYQRQFPEVGTLKWQNVYTQKDGRLKLKSGSASAACVDRREKDFDEYGALFAKNQLKAAGPIKLYTDTSKKNVSFTAKKGDVLKLGKIKYVKGHFYVQLTKGSKKGWLMLEDAGEPLFGGVADRLAG